MRDIAIPCNVYRGGTSRGILFLESDLPYPREIRDRILLRIFGSPDPRQIDGLGGATSLTSKALVVGPTDQPDADVIMTFAQVGVNAPVVDWGGNCGNMTTAVGVFAIEVGLVEPTEPSTLVRIFSVNTGLKVHAHVPVRDGEVQTEGDYLIPGVSQPGARIDLDWLQPGGAATGRVLPTGQSMDRIDLSDGRKINVSIVDAANPVVFCEASVLGLNGTELPQDIEARQNVCQTLEEIRSAAAEMIGIVPKREQATARSPGLPKVAFVAPAQGYLASDGRGISAAEHDLQGRLMSMQTAHRSYGGAAAICTAVAAQVSGTLVHSCRGEVSDDPELVRIAHPSGVMDVLVKMTSSEAEPLVVSARIGRTARRIMSGVAYVPVSLIEA